MAMQEEERAALLVAILCIQIDRRIARLTQPSGLVSLVEWRDFGIGQIGQKAEVDVRILIREIASFEFVEEFVNLLLVQQQSGHDDEAGRVFRNAL